MRLTLPHRKRYSVLMPFIVVSAVFFSIAAVRADAADWPNWRGPNHNGISGERGWMKAWLEDFAYRIELEPWMFVIAGVLAFLISGLTVSVQSVRAAIDNPVECLKYE